MQDFSFECLFNELSLIKFSEILFYHHFTQTKTQLTNVYITIQCHMDTSMYCRAFPVTGPLAH